MLLFVNVNFCRVISTEKPWKKQYQAIYDNRDCVLDIWCFVVGALYLQMLFYCENRNIFYL